MKKFNEIVVEAVNKKQFYRIKLKEILKAMGNKWKKLDDSTKIYMLMQDVEQVLMKKYFMKYHEVQGADTTDMMDWADSHAPMPDVAAMIKKKDKNLFKTLKTMKDKDTALTLIQKFMDKNKIYGIEAYHVLYSKDLWNVRY